MTAHESTIQTYKRGERVIEVDDMSLLDPGMTDTYVVYENDELVGEFCLTNPFGLNPGTFEEQAWGSIS